MECMSCHGEVSEDKRFCIHCGAALLQPCPACGTSNAWEARFCGDCGAPLVRAVPSKDPAVATTSRPAPAERQQLTVMFVDLVGSTALSTRLDPEDTREIISAYHRCAATQITKAGGFVAKYMGDGVLAYFGNPEAHEDDAERAVGTGLALVETVAKLEIAASATLQARVGIATGIVVVGDLVDAGAAQEHAVVGETPNLAAHLQAIAEPDRVIVVESTRKLLGNLFELQDLGAKDQGRRNVARGLLAPIYTSFTEGLDTADLQQARALLDRPN